MKSSAKKVYGFLTLIFVVSILLSVVIFLGGWTYIFKLSGELAKARTESEYLSKEVEALEDLSFKYKKIEDSQPLALDSIPTNKELSSFMADMESLARVNNLKIKQSNIGTSSKSKVSDLDLSQMVKQDGYYVLPVKISVEGSFASFNNYLQAVYSLRRVTSVSDINIIKTTKALTERKDEVKADFVASIYVKR